MIRLLTRIAVPVEGGVSLDALSIFIIRMKIQNFKTTIVEKVGYIKEYIYIMFLNEL